MGKFLNLVQNESIKILHRISTWIMLAIIVLSALSLNLLSLVVQNHTNNYYHQSSQNSYISGMYDSQLSYLKNSKPNGYQQDVEKFEFLRDNKIFDSDWRSMATTEMFHIKAQIASASSSSRDTEAIKTLTKAEQQYRTAILSNSWKDYYLLKISKTNADTSLSAEKKEMLNWQYQYSLDNNIKPNDSDWKSKLVSQISDLKFQVSNSQEDQKSGKDVDLENLDETNKNIQTNLYRLEHNISVNIASASLIENHENLNFWDIFSTSSKMIAIISLLVIVIAGSCVANEFSSGTIKFLLINPVKRGKILFSKYAMILSFAFLMLIFFYVMNIIFGIIFYGAGDLNLPYVYSANGTVHTTSGFAYIAWKYLLASVDILVMATLAFAISSLIRSSALAIGVSVFVMLGGNTLIFFLKNLLHLDWARYLIFANTNLSAIMDGKTAFAHQSVLFALILVAIHIFVFLLTAWDGFVRREV